MVKQVKSAGPASVSATGTQTEAPQHSGALAVPLRTALPRRNGAIVMADLIDLYMADYTGRDSARVQRLGWWQERIGATTLQDLSDDQVHEALEQLADQTNRYYAGRDADGKPIYKARKKPIAPATVNRYCAALAAVITWSMKRRIAPQGYVHPCRTIERRPENNEKTRFLSDAERERLLEACKAATWPKLYLITLMALTTGARRGELLALRWQDIDLERSVAHCGRSKNGDLKVLPLVPAVVEALQPFVVDKPTALVFASKRNPGQAFTFHSNWVDALKHAHIRNFRFHDLRHSCASILASSGATLLEIADVLGHRQLQMTKRYSHLTTAHKAALVNRVLGGIQ